MKVGVFEWRRKKGDVKRYVKGLKHTWQQKLRGSQRRATSESGERESRERVFCFVRVSIFFPESPLSRCNCF